MLPYLGRMRKIIKCETDKVYLKGTELFISSSAGADDLIKWLKESALALFKKRTDAFAEIMNTNYASVKISNAKTRWVRAAAVTVSIFRGALLCARLKL